MLADRDYMRTGNRFGGFSWSTWLMIGLAAVFVLVHIIDVQTDWPILPYAGLTRDGVSSGWVWQLLTYQVIHLKLTHILLNLLGIWAFGRMLGQYWEGRPCLTVFFVGGLVGGVLQGAGMWASSEYFGDVTVGASGGVCALLAAYATLAPHDEVRPLGLFSIRARTFFLAVVGFELISWLFTWGNTGIAHAAHMGGFAGGILLVRLGQGLLTANPWQSMMERRRRRASLVRAARVPVAPRTKPTVSLPPDDFIRREIDPILDKISAHGMQSLTPDERQLLERAGERLARR